MYLEDLRKEGYRMNDRKQSLDKFHIKGLVKELARLHASSYVLIEKEGFDEIKNKFPYLDRFLIIEFDDAFKELDGKGFLEEMGKMSNHLCGKLPGYEYMTKYFERNVGTIRKKLESTLPPNGDKFRVICHGDCWNNNFLFK